MCLGGSCMSVSMFVSVMSGVGHYFVAKTTEEGTVGASIGTDVTTAEILLFHMYSCTYTLF